MNCIRRVEADGNYFRSKFSPVKETIFFPGRGPDYDHQQDELGLAYVRSAHSQDPIALIMKRCTYSMHRANDQRSSKRGIGLVGTIDTNPRAIVEILWAYYYDGFAAARKEIIDQEENLAKLVGVVAVFCGTKVLLVPRKDKRILSESATVSVMESLRPSDIAFLFQAEADYIATTGDSPWSLSPDDPFFSAPYGIYDSVLDNILSRGIREEAPRLRSENLLLHCIVGGTKDLGLVWRYHASPLEMDFLREVHGGIIIDLSQTTYHQAISSYDFKPDGWTEAILKSINKNFL